MRLCVIGTGYVGLVAGACFADSGNEVVCVDLDAAKVSRLEAGQMPLYEPGLAELVQRTRASGRLAFTTDTAAAVARAQVVFIAVGTPEAASGEADLRAVLAVAAQVGRALTDYTVVVDKSTVPVGTADQVHATIAAHTKVPFDVVSNPEFLKEGAALEDFLRPDRVVIGTDSARARAVMGELYAPFVRTENPILFMDARSAELTKYAANAMLAARISFINDIAALCEKTGADVDCVRKALGADRRIGYPFLFPGLGYGGSCFPKDVRALIATFAQHGLPTGLLSEVEASNARARQALLPKARAHLGSLRGRVLAVWGLSFKPRTDDVREAPALELIEALLAEGAQVQAYDPVAMDNARARLGERVRFAANMYQALEGAEALFLATEWNDFRHPDFPRMKALMKRPLIFDGRNLFAPERMAALGFTWSGMGRPS